MALADPKVCDTSLTRLRHKKWKILGRVLVLILQAWHQLIFLEECRNKRAVTPHARAMSALVQAYAATDLKQALHLYSELQKDSVGVAAVTLSNRYMWQSLIEAACRNHQLSAALRVRSISSYSLACQKILRFLQSHGSFLGHTRGFKLGPCQQLAGGSYAFLGAKMDISDTAVYSSMMIL